MGFKNGENPMNWTAYVQGKVHGFFMALDEIQGHEKRMASPWSWNY